MPSYLKKGETQWLWSLKLTKFQVVKDSNGLEHISISSAQAHADSFILTGENYGHTVWLCDCVVVWLCDCVAGCCVHVGL